MAAAVRTNMGLVQLNMGSTAQAVALFQAAIDIDSTHTDALCGLAEAHERQGDDGTARGLYEKALACSRSKDAALPLGPPRLWLWLRLWRARGKR